MEVDTSLSKGSLSVVGIHFMEQVLFDDRDCPLRMKLRIIYGKGYVIDDSDLIVHLTNFNISHSHKRNLPKV